LRINPSLQKDSTPLKVHTSALRQLELSFTSQKDCEDATNSDVDSKRSFSSKSSQWDSLSNPGLPPGYTQPPGVSDSSPGLKINCITPIDGPHNSQEYEIPQLFAAQWPTILATLPVLSMSKSARLCWHKEKKLLEAVADPTSKQKLSISLNLLLTYIIIAGKQRTLNLRGWNTNFENWLETMPVIFPIGPILDLPSLALPSMQSEGFPPLTSTKVPVRRPQRDHLRRRSIILTRIGWPCRGFAMATSRTANPHQSLIKGFNLTRRVTLGIRVTTTINKTIRPKQLAQSHAGCDPGRDGDGSDTSGSNPDLSYHEVSDGTTKSSSWMEEDVFRHTHSHSRWNPSGYLSTGHRISSPYWSMTFHPDSYWEKCSCCPSKYLRDIHIKIHRQINNKVSVLSDINASGGKNGPRVPNPPKYGGLPNTKDF
jgi:hypothetical protein